MPHVFTSFLFEAATSYCEKLLKIHVKFKFEYMEEAHSSYIFSKVIVHVLSETFE